MQKVNLGTVSKADCVRSCISRSMAMLQLLRKMTVRLVPIKDWVIGDQTGAKFPTEVQVTFAR
jgi:hypothetical protein